MKNNFPPPLFCLILNMCLFHKKKIHLKDLILSFLFLMCQVAILRRKKCPSFLFSKRQDAKHVNSFLFGLTFSTETGDWDIDFKEAGVHSLYPLETDYNQ